MIADSNLPFEKLRDSSVLVTGATGLIGVSLVRALLCINRKKKLSIKIIAFARNKEKAIKIYGDLMERQELELLFGDIMDEVCVEQKVDYIFHCASVTTSKTMVSQPVETLMTAVLGTKNMLDLAVKKKVRSFVYISSMEMYGSFYGREQTVSENDLGYIDPLKVRSNYPESKRLCENMCIAYLSEYDVPVRIARLAQTFGAGILPGENRVFAQFARSVINAENIVLHTLGESEGNYCYTRDTVKGLITILLKGNDGEAYNVTNPDAHTSIAGMAHMVSEKLADGEIKVVFDIPENNTFGYAADTKMKLNSDKLQKLGWIPEVGLEEAYKRLIASMKSEKI
jgi:nucleoside-diphosphate-sugar epimerase